MFDFAWSEIAVIGVVALIAIGPKDMPVAIKAITGALKKARRMAAEFQGHVDEMIREADLDDVRKEFNEIRSFNFKGAVEKTIDPDGSLRSTLSQNPLAPTAPAPASAAVAASSETAAFTADPVSVGAYETAVLDRPAEADVQPIYGAEYHPPAPEAAAAAAEAPEALEAPAFVPPGAVQAPEPPAFVPPPVARAAAPRGRF